MLGGIIFGVIVFIDIIFILARYRREKAQEPEKSTSLCKNCGIIMYSDPSEIATICRVCREKQE